MLLLVNTWEGHSRCFPYPYRRKERGQCITQTTVSTTSDVSDDQLGVSHMLGQCRLTILFSRVGILGHRAVLNWVWMDSLFAGVFYIIYGGVIVGFIFLICEWIVATFSSVDPQDIYVSFSSCPVAGYLPLHYGRGSPHLSLTIGRRT